MVTHRHILDISYFLCFTCKSDTWVMALQIMFQHPAVSQEFRDHTVIGYLTEGIVRFNSDWLS